MKPDDDERLNLCVSEGEAIQALSGKDFVERYVSWQRKALDAVALAFGSGSERYAEFSNFVTILPPSLSFEQQYIDRLIEQLKLLRRYVRNL